MSCRHQDMVISEKEHNSTFLLYFFGSGEESGSGTLPINTPMVIILNEGWQADGGGGI